MNWLKRSAYIAGGQQDTPLLSYRSALHDPRHLSIGKIKKRNSGGLDWLLAWNPDTVNESTGGLTKYRPSKDERNTGSPKWGWQWGSKCFKGMRMMTITTAMAMMIEMKEWMRTDTEMLETSLRTNSSTEKTWENYVSWARFWSLRFNRCWWMDWWGLDVGRCWKVGWNIFCCFFCRFPVWVFREFNTLVTAHSTHGTHSVHECDSSWRGSGHLHPHSCLEPML